MDWLKRSEWWGESESESKGESARNKAIDQESKRVKRRVIEREREGGREWKLKINWTRESEGLSGGTEWEWTEEMIENARDRECEKTRARANSAKKRKNALEREHKREQEGSESWEKWIKYDRFTQGT